MTVRCSRHAHRAEPGHGSARFAVDETPSVQSSRASMRRARTAWAPGVVGDRAPGDARRRSHGLHAQSSEHRRLGDATDSTWSLPRGDGGAYQLGWRSVVAVLGVRGHERATAPMQRVIGSGGPRVTGPRRSIASASSRCHGSSRRRARGDRRGPSSWCINPTSVLDALNDGKRAHGESGLIDRVRASNRDAAAERLTIDFVSRTWRRRPAAHGELDHQTGSFGGT